MDRKGERPRYCSMGEGSGSRSGEGNSKKKKKSFPSILMNHRSVTNWVYTTVNLWGQP